MLRDESLKLTENELKHLRCYMTGQIWEECPICGNEPVYMPSFHCEDCLRKMIIRARPKS